MATTKKRETENERIARLSSESRDEQKYLGRTRAQMAKEFPDLSEARINSIFEQKYGGLRAPKSLASRTPEERAADKAQAERNQRAREAARREQAIKKAEAGKDELAKLRAQQYKGKLTSEQQQHNKDTQTKIDAEKKRRGELYEKSVRAKYEKQKAEYEKKPAAAKAIHNMVHGGFRPRVTGLANLNAGHYRTQQAVLDKISREDRKKLIQEAAAKQRAQKAAKPAPAAAKPAPATAKAPPANAPATIPAKPAATAKSAALPVNPANIAKPAATVKPAYVPPKPPINVRKGGAVKFSASKRSDGIAQRGKTKGRYV